MKNNGSTELYFKRGDDVVCWRRLAKRWQAIPDTPGGAWRPRFTCEKHFRPNEKRPCRWGPTRSIPRELHRGMRGRIR